MGESGRNKWGWLRHLAGSYGWLILIGLAAIGGRIWQGPWISDPPGGSAATQNPVVSSFARAIGGIQNRYFQPPEWSDLTRHAIERMLLSLDPHSRFHDRTQFTEMQNEQSSSYYGIGASINQRSNGIYVVGVMPGKPADRAGVRYGDAIVAVDDHLTDTWSQATVLTSVRGERGTPVEITVERAGHAGRLTFRIVRDVVPYLSVRNRFMLRPGTGYVDLTGGFSQETTTELREAISELKSQGMDRLLIDLRNNPGGLLRQAIEVSEIFLPAGKVIASVLGREGRSLQRSYLSENQNPERMPLALLVDEGTASAAEITAAAMQENDRACIVGEESFGKGLVQTVFRLRGGTGLTLTTARYLTPKGRSIHRSFAEGGIYDYGLSRKFKLPTAEPESGSGGISPDLPDRPGRSIASEEEILRLRDACFQFVRFVNAGLVVGLEDWRGRGNGAGLRPRPGDYQVNNLVRRRFRQFVRDHPELLIRESLPAPVQKYVDQRLRAEMIAAAYGAEAADRYLLEDDPQVLRALDWLKKAPLP